MANVSLMPVPSEQAGAMCANCGAALLADQRYCLACGQPCSPVRLAFLDVLQSEQGRAGAQGRQGFGPAGTIDVSPLGYRPLEYAPMGYPPGPGQDGLNGWLRRYAGLLGLCSVLLMCLIVGLLVGHWVTQGKAPSGPQVYKIEGLSGVPAAAATTTPTTTSTTSTASKTAGASTSASAKEEAEEAKEAASEAKVEKPAATNVVKATPTKLKKLSSTTGKQHEEEVNALGDQPIETGG